MRSLISLPLPRAYVAAILAMALLIGGTASVDARRPPKPTPTPTPAPTPTLPSGSATIAIASTGTLEPSGEYATVDVTITCPEGWTATNGSLYLLRPDRIGGAGSFSVTCTGTPQVARARAVNGNRFLLGDWDATAYVDIVKSGQKVRATNTRTVRLQPGVTARIADQGQLTGTSGGGVAIAIAAACPNGAAGTQSSVTVSQGTAVGRAFFSPTCDRFSHTHLLQITAAQGTFHTGGAAADASVAVTWDGGTFSGADSRPISLLESSTGDNTPPTTPAGLSANVFGDGETWLSWGASSDNATPSGRISYEVFLNGRFDQGIGGGYTQAILYADLGVVNNIDVVAVDGAGNRSAPASVTVDCSQGWCQ